MSDTVTTTQHQGAAHAEQAPGLPQLDPSSFSSQLFWLTLTFVALYVLMARSAVPRIRGVLEQRQGRIRQDLDQAESFSSDAETARTSYEKLQADARGEAHQLISGAQAAIASMQEKKFSEVDGELAEKIGKARVEIGKKREAVRDKLTPVARDVALQVVEKLIGVAPSEKLLDKTLSSRQDEPPQGR